MKIPVVPLALAIAALAPPAARAAPAPHPLGPIVSAAAASGGGCTYRWDTGSLDDEQLLDRAVADLKRAIDRVGGPAILTEQDVPVPNLQFDDTVPYRCVRTSIETLMRAGYIRLRIARPHAGVDAWADPMVFDIRQDDLPQLHAPMKEVHNRLTFGSNGKLGWNGIPISSAILRQYSELTQQMNPVPWVFVEIDDAAPWQQAIALLSDLHRAHVTQIVLKPAAGAKGELVSLSAR
jgi:biopolymer transport protein ExbD